MNLVDRDLVVRGHLAGLAVLAGPMGRDLAQADGPITQ